MFEDYLQLVLSDYEKKRQQGDLSIRLKTPSPAKIKNECLAVCAKRFSRSDGRVMEAFFGEGNDQQALLKIIRRYEIDKFKPLIKFLRKETSSTDPKNIELLAWLIDFHPRPFELSKDYKNLATESPVVAKPPGPDHPDPNKKVKEPQPAPTQSKKKGFSKWAVGMGAVSLVVGMAIFIFGKTIPASAPINGNAYCMYWAGDHYEPADCKPRGGDTLLIRLDSLKLFGFKKITQPETITKDDIGQVSYIKLDGKREYFTDTGFHPVYTHKKLKPLTSYIYIKHIEPLKKN